MVCGVFKWKHKQDMPCLVCTWRVGIGTSILQDFLYGRGGGGIIFVFKEGDEIFPLRNLGVLAGSEDSNGTAYCG